MNIFYINICDFRNVDETGLAFRQFDKRTKIRDAGHDTLDHTANFNGQINSSSLCIKEYRNYYNLDTGIVSSSIMLICGPHCRAIPHAGSSLIPHGLSSRYTPAC